MDFINTPGDERFASIPAQGDLLYYSTKFKGTYDIIKAQIPQEFQPLKVVYLKGQITDQNDVPMEAFIQIYDAESKKLVQYDRTSVENAGFEFYLASGQQYDFSIVPLASSYAFYSEIYDLKDLEISTRKWLDIKLEELKPGVSFPLKCLSFENDTTLNNISRFELSRLIKLLKNNPGTKVEIGIHRERLEPDTLSQNDTVFNLEPIVSESSLDIVDSLNFEQEIEEPYLDPTEVQAQTLSTYFRERGVPEYIVQTKGYADSQPIVPEEAPQEDQLLNRRYQVKVVE
jgi:hypothetical protein